MKRQNTPGSFSERSTSSPATKRSSVCGFGCIQRQLSSQSIAAKPTSPELEQAICDAVLLATCLYWKPVLCLQRSVCAVRLLRKHGVVGRLVIGYRPAPFFSHAWVE